MNNFPVFIEELDENRIQNIEDLGKDSFSATPRKKSSKDGKEIVTEINTSFCIGTNHFFENLTFANFSRCIPINIRRRQFDLTNFEYNFVQPYVYMAIILGIIFSIFVKNISSVFCGSYIGSIIFEMVSFDMFGQNMETNFLLGGEMMVTSIIIVCLTYAIFFWLRNFITNLKLKKKTKSLN